jgi:hypothetical protein
MNIAGSLGLKIGGDDGDADKGKERLEELKMHIDIACLTHSMDAVDGLRLDCETPPRIHYEDIAPSNGSDTRCQCDAIRGQGFHRRPHAARARA